MRDSKNQGSGSSKETTESSVVTMFTEIAKVLDARNDKYERIVKLNRDITIESKRIIFHLHRINPHSEAERTENRFANLKDTFIRLALELENEDNFYFIRAYTGGVQEYIEALSLSHFLLNKTLISHKEVQAGLTYEVDASLTANSLAQASGFRDQRQYGGRGNGYRRGRGNQQQYNQRYKRSEQGDDSTARDELKQSQQQEEETVPCEEIPIVPAKKTISVVVTQLDFMLGIADLTGELMRQCILSCAQGDKAFAFNTCGFVQQIYQGVLGIYENRRELQRKMGTLYASTVKMEKACYQLVIRESRELSAAFDRFLIEDEEESHHSYEVFD